MKGIVASGTGEGKKFLSMPEYREQFIKKYGLEPYPGTLNLEVGKNIVSDIRKAGGDIIHGFTKDGREYGNVLCIPVNIFEENCFLILPEKSIHGDMVEIVAEENLRKKYHIHDGAVLDIAILPMIKNSIKRKMWAVPTNGNGRGEITVFYDLPYGKRRDVCLKEGKNVEGGYRKTFPEREVACILFDAEERKALETLLHFVEENCHGKMSPPRLIAYSLLNEWQIEVKTKEN
ncbi:MAG TPA: CTP-dependent riboflavin kinase [Thermoplasmatales archaeon]|nr:CTP-dependent riboflavin kinase [Thermoplasmatales archaeon]